jgi:uncharacterized membrane protein
MEAAPMHRLAAVAPALAATLALAQPSFTDLGGLPQSPYACRVAAVSGDGSTVVGGFGLLGEAFRWTRATGMVGLGVLPPHGAGSWANAVSFDGSVIVGGAPGWVDPPVPIETYGAFRWSIETGMTPLSVPSLYLWEATGVSADGSVIVGDLNPIEPAQSGFIWTTASGPGALDCPGLTCFANAVSALGGTVVGTFQPEPEMGYAAIRWTDGDPEELIGGSPYPQGAEAMAANRDGSVIIGYGDGTTALRWVRGRPQPLQRLPNGRPIGGVPRAVTADGGTIVGNLSAGEGPAFIWDPIRGLRDLRQVLTNDYGLDVSAWVSLWPEGISADGRVIVGEGDAEVAGRGWIADLGPICRADLDSDRALSVGDLLAFFSLFSAGEARADFNGDGQLTVADFLAFLSAYAGGCP